jgi:fumarate hydratase subunit beta
VSALEPPLTAGDVAALRAGDVVRLTGTLYGARDAAHARLLAMLDAGEEPPFPLEGAVLYYVGPTPTRPGLVTGSAGPTTASRMDRYTPALLERGVRAVLGKGGRGEEVRRALQAHGAVALAALGGGGALAAQRITSSEVIAFDDLGPEAVRRLEVVDLPAWVVHDVNGRDLYADARRDWAARLRPPAPA